MSAQAGLLVILGLTVVSALVSFLAAAAVRQLALRWGVVDRPELAPQRKQLGKTVPLLGGTAIWFAVVFVTAIMLPQLTTGYLLPKHLFGIWIAGTIIIIGGWFDDRFSLSPKRQLLFPILASLVVIVAGIGIEYISNPLGGIWNLQQWQWTVFTYHGLPYQITLWADLFTVLWLMVSMYTTKLLDGLDGLVSGVGMIGGVIIGLLSLSATVVQPETATLAFIFAGACAGFLIWNFAPAKLYLGEGGALFVGFMLGVLAIVSGSKIATALLILGLPLLDVLAVIIRRVVIEKKSALSGDLFHLHFQLQQRGWGPRLTVLVYYLITLAFGLSTLLVEGIAKVIVLGILAVCGLSLVLYASLQRTHRQ